MSVMTVPLQMQLTKMKFFWEGKTVQNPNFFDCFHPLYSPFNCPRKHLRFAERMSLAALQHPTKCQVTIWREKHYGRFCIYAN